MGSMVCTCLLSAVLLGGKLHEEKDSANIAEVNETGMGACHKLVVR